MSREKQYKTIIEKLLCPWLGSQYGADVSVRIKDDELVVTFKYPLGPYKSQVLDQIKKAIQSGNLPLIPIKVNYDCPMYKTQLPLTKISRVKNLMAITSGKGGVGKTTSACHLAQALVQQGYKVGIFDADIYGPNVPLMMGAQDQEAHTSDDERFLPVMHHGIATMSLAYLIAADKPMVWRGPILSKTLLQILMQTEWPELDFLLLDLPPGTGDTQLTLAQKIPLMGAVAITTPHPMALSDVLKGIKMFEKVSVPMLGYVNNMAMHTCSHCGHKDPLWPHDKSFDLQGQLKCLGNVPFDPKYAESIGKIAHEDYFKMILTALVQQVLALPKHPSGNIPTIVTE